MRADDQYIIDCSPSYIARQWALVVESGGDPQRLGTCLELALQTLTTFALAEGLIHFDWAHIRETMEADSDLGTIHRSKKGLTLGVHWKLYRCLMKMLKAVPKEERFFELHTDWFWKNSSERKLSDSAMLLEQKAISLRNVVQGHQPANVAPDQIRSMGGDYRDRVTELMRALSEWWQHYPMFSVASKRRLGPQQYEGALWWFLGRNRKKALDLQWTQSELEQSSSIHVVRLDDGRVRLLDLKRLLVVNAEASTNRFIEDFSVFRRLDFGQNAFVLSDGNHPPTERSVGLNTLRLNPVYEEKYGASFKPVVRPIRERYERQYREALTDDGRVDEVEREGFAHYDLGDQVEATIQAKVLIEEAELRLGGAIDPEAYPALAKLQYRSEGLNDAFDQAAEEFSKLFEQHESTRRRRAGDFHFRVSRGMVRALVGLGALAMMLLFWRHVAMPNMVPTFHSSGEASLLKGMTWEGTRRPLGLMQLERGFKIVIDGVDDAGADAIAGRFILTDSDREYPFVGSRDEANGFQLTLVDDLDIGFLDRITLVRPLKRIQIDGNQMSGLDQGGWTVMSAQLVDQCGDGVVQPPEDCDDGINVVGGVCNADCSSNVVPIDAGNITKGFRDDEWFDESGQMPLSPHTRWDDNKRAVAAHSRPPTKVRIDPFWIMKTEVSHAAVLEFVARPIDDFGRLNRVERVEDAQLWYETQIKQARVDLSDLSNSDTDPGNPAQLTLEQAIAFCGFMGGALPTEDHWEFAARGEDPEPRPYPWGTKIPTDENDYHLMNGWFNKPDGSTWKSNNGNAHPVDELRGCTPEGVCNMAGNTAEFVLPGTVKWEQVGDPEQGTARLLAKPPGTPSKNPRPLQHCWGDQLRNPYGRISGKVTDCIAIDGGQKKQELKTYDADAIRLIVKGGNHRDTTPHLYMPAGRYMAPNNHREGFRCAFLSDPTVADSIEPEVD